MHYNYRKEGYVSIWLGNGIGLNKYVSSVYIDEDERRNQFEQDFEMTFDEDFMESENIDMPTNDLDVLLEDSSYWETFIGEVKVKLRNPMHQSYNAVVLLYDFKYDSNISSIQHEGLHLQFVGHFKFEK